MRKFMGWMIALLFCAPFLVWMTTCIVQGVLFDRNVKGHLKRAADANTINLAEKELAIVISYLKENRMTEGYTSVIWTTPDEDVGFWYQNLVASLEELRNVPEGAMQFEKSNILMKLHETLIDHGQSLTVTAPSGISIFPHNMIYALWWIISMILGVVGGTLGLVIADGY